MTKTAEIQRIEEGDIERKIRELQFAMASPLNRNEKRAAIAFARRVAP